MYSKLGKKALILSAITALYLGLPAIMHTSSVHAAYSLNEEVASPTPSLTQASEIGLKVYHNPALQNLSDKDAILVMSFGTTYPETREKTILATVREIQEAHPHTKVITAFSSHIIIDRIKAKEGITFPTPEEALDMLHKEGYTRVAMVSLDIIPGMEYNYKSNVYNTYKPLFKTLTLSTPLMYWMGQEEQADDIMTFIEALSSQLPALQDNEAILLMAHGTPDPSNAYYTVIQERLKAAGHNHTYVYTVEGWPRLEHILPTLKKEGIKHVYLMPMMMVAGDHALNDMAGDEEDSHKILLEKEGFSVSPYLHGLGENKNIQHIFAAHAKETVDALNKD